MESHSVMSTNVKQTLGFCRGFPTHPAQVLDGAPVLLGCLFTLGEEWRAFMATMG